MSENGLTEHRLTQLETKVDELLDMVRQMATVESDVRNTRRDVDNAHETLRAQRETMNLQSQWQSRTDPVIVDLQRAAQAVVDPQVGLAVRVSKLEGAQTLVKYMAVTLVGSMISVLGFVLTFAWQRIFT